VSADQAKRELEVFQRFVKLAQLPVELGSITKRQPPEADIRCQFRDGEQAAFELVEICNPKNNRFMGSAKRISEMILSTYLALPSLARRAFDERFINRPISFYFRSDATIATIRNVLPALLSELISAQENGWEYKHFSTRVAKAVIKVRHGGKLCIPGGFNFNLGDSFDPTTPFDAIAHKLAKEYETDCSVELVADFRGLIWERGRYYRNPIKTLVSEHGLGPFRRIWVMDSDGIGLVIPEHLRPRPNVPSC